MDGKESSKKNTSTFQPIKILKRQPNSDPCLVEAPSRLAPNRIKTLEEREAAYAEARLRILGPSTREDCEAVTNGHASRITRNSVVARNIKIISNSVRQNNNGKT